MTGSAPELGEDSGLARGTWSSGHLTMAYPRRSGGSASMGGRSSPSGSEQDGCQRRDFVLQEETVAQNASQGQSL